MAFGGDARVQPNELRGDSLLDGEVWVPEAVATHQDTRPSHIRCEGPPLVPWRTPS